MSFAVAAAEWHVATGGDDQHRGTRRAPLRTIQRAADLAQPGDVITVHAGVYRERVNPPRGGESEGRRIVYRAAHGATVEIKGSEVITNWVRVQDGVWKVTLPNGFFGGFNPYSDLIRGDWFEPKGRPHHTGAVYLNGVWLTEAVTLDEVLAPEGRAPAWLQGGGQGYLLNVASLRPVGSGWQGARVPAAAFASQQGVQTAPSTEGGECIGWIEHGDWVRYAGVDFGAGSDRLEIRVSSASAGGVIEVRLDGPDGELLGTGRVASTGDWQAWTTLGVALKPQRGVRTVCLAFREASPVSGRSLAPNPRLWYAQVDATQTHIWAQFPGVDPNRELVEINVRRTVFYPDQPGRNFITVRGFVMRHAATPWAPPTAEQIGLIGTHWSKGWVIEDNVVSHSVCSGIALGKHGDEYDNTSANTAEGYVKTIERGHARGWTRERIGHHVVRNNRISHCEQAGIVGSLGAAFSTVTGNVIHDIHVRRLFTGAEMAGIKFHAAIDSVIAGNHIHRTCLGLWLDWMAQGTRVSGNLFHDNLGQDLFVEVNHGPFLVENNLFLSPVSLLDMSEGGAYAHNLFLGKIIARPELSRDTPYHPPHSTEVAGLVNIRGGDNRFYNNVLVGAGSPAGTPGKDPEWAGAHGLWVYDFREYPSVGGGNVHWNGARAGRWEADATVDAAWDPGVRLVDEGERWFLEWTPGAGLRRAPTVPVTTELLGKARVSGAPFVNADGSALRIDRDYAGTVRDGKRPTPGPFEKVGRGTTRVRVR